MVSISDLSDIVPGLTANMNLNAFRSLSRRVKRLILFREAAWVR